ncbi:MAG: RNA polymerase sigma factor [Gammaproteobacteria bacterium]|nr:RNA polymerase sigma factor [Gammaproteobacteria bacterium]
MQHDWAINKQIGKDRTLDKTHALDQFLSQVERRAFKIAKLAVGNHDEALDIVQDSMIGLVQKYANRPADEWTPLFYHILQSRIRDWYRKNKVRTTWMSWLGFRKNGEEEELENALEALPDPHGRDPSQVAANEHSMEDLEVAIQTLPLRQQQAFLLRTWEGLSVADTATAMKCSQGSVKTHYSRAVHTLREALEEHWT